MAFANFLSATVAKKRKINELEEAILKVKSFAIKDANFELCKDSVSLIENFISIKMGTCRYSAWKKFVADIPSCGRITMKKTIHKILEEFLNDEIDSEEAEDYFKWTKVVIEKEDEEDLKKKLLLAGNTDTQPAAIVISPPVQKCIKCKSTLSIHNKPSHASTINFSGSSPALKFTLKCQICKLYYGYAKYGNSADGYTFYEKERKFVECSDECFIARKMLQFHSYLGLHCQVSFEGFAEAYNSYLEKSSNQELTVLANKLKPGKRQGIDTYREELDRKIVSKGFYALNTEDEIRERGMKWSFKGKDENALDAFMEEIEKKRTSELYPHVNCTNDCKKRGCENFTVQDGVWKLKHPHCMWPVIAKATNLPGVNLPDVCVNEPMGQNEAFCQEHCKNAIEDGIPISLRGFLSEFCGITSNNGDELPEDKNLKDVRIVNEKATRLRKDESKQTMLEESQGLTDVLELARNSELVTMEYEDDEEEAFDLCNKDTGETQKILRKWSRGILHFVRGGGHIEKWCPIYKSESPSQVFLITIQYLYQRLKEKDVSEWEKFGLCYDNMCNVDRLKVARKPLPFPEPYDKMWLSIGKYIDDLHLRNHKRPECRTKYSTENLRDEWPDLNTPVCEQTFIWASKFKKILCAMPKRRFLFFYHRMVVLRNKYTEKCYMNGKKPLLPSLKVKNN